MNTPTEVAENVLYALTFEEAVDFIRARDAEVKAATLRSAANALYDDDRANGSHGQPLSLASWLRDLADRIEQGANR